MKLSYEKCMARPAYKNPTQKINEQFMVIDMRVKSLKNYINLKLKEEKTKFVKEVARLDSMSPLKTLARGYSIITKEDNNACNGKIVRSVKDLERNEKINIKLVDGEKKAIIQ